MADSGEGMELGSGALSIDRKKGVNGLPTDSCPVSGTLNHRWAPTESVAMSKQGLTVMFSKCPATLGSIINKYILCTQTMYKQFSAYIQLLYGLQFSLGNLS
jgi:hypothetical protein